MGAHSVENEQVFRKQSDTEELWESSGILCSTPMMGAPKRVIGNAALGDHAGRALDEFLFRTCGGIHGLVGSLHYNLDICVFSLNQIVTEMGSMLSV